MKYLFIELAIQDGERMHNHRVLHTTTGNNVQFAAERYAASYWGHGTRESRKDNFWWVDYEITIKVELVMELTKKEYDFMSGIFSGQRLP